MLTNCLTACAHLTNTVSEIVWDICEKNRHFIISPLHSTLPLGGFPSEYRHPLWDGKTRMVSLPDGEKNFEDIFICFDVIHECDRWTDRQTLHDSNDRACIASRGKNHRIFMKFCTQQQILNWMNVTWSKWKSCIGQTRSSTERVSCFFNFAVCFVWWTKLATRQLFTAH